MAIPPLILRFYADSSGVKAGVASAQRSVGGLKGFVKQNSAMIGVALAGAAVAFGAASVKAFNESQLAIAQTNAVLKSTEGIAGVTAQEVENLASEMQRLTTFSDEEVRSAENMLLTFTNIKDDIFPDTTKAVLDMSQALGQDLKSSSIQLGKALNDPILGLTSLGRVGVKFTQQTRDRIKALVEEGHVLQAQKIILHELATEFGGSAQAAAKTFSGQVTQLKNEVNDLMEQFGKMITQIGSKYIPALREGIAELERFGGFIADTADKLDFLKPAFDKATEGSTLFDNALTNIIPGMKTFNLILGAIPEKGARVTMSQQEVAAAFDRARIAAHNLLNILLPLGNGLRSVSGSYSVEVLTRKTGLPNPQQRQHGGPVSGMRPYIVGERGPELFVPKTNGDIVPNDKMGGGPQTIVIKLGDETLERVVVKGMNRAARRAG